MFFVLNQSLSIIYPDEENPFIMPNHKKKRLFFDSVFVEMDRQTLTLKMVGSDVFLRKPKYQ